jgi:hypothetical protein
LAQGLFQDKQCKNCCFKASGNYDEKHERDASCHNYWTVKWGLERGTKSLKELEGKVFIT